MQTGEIEYNRVPILTYNPPVVHGPNQPIEHIQTGQIEYNRVPTLTYNQPVVQVPNQPIEYNQLHTLTYNHTPVQNNQAQAIERGAIQNTNQPTIHYSNQTSNQPIEQMQTGEILQVTTLTYKHPPVQDNQLQTIESTRI